MEMQKGQEVVSRVEMIGPERAKQLLAANTGNRRIRTSHWKKLAARMAAGEWRLTHQGVAVADDGELLDGQHRLIAIVDSGVTVPMMIAEGLSHDSFEWMDVGAFRSMSDRTGMSKRVTAVLRFYLMHGNPPISDPSPDQVRHAYRDYKTAIHAVVDFTAPALTGFQKAALRWPMICYVYEMPEKGMAFFRSVMSGERLASGDPALVLRNHILRLSGDVGHITKDDDLYWRTIAAIRADMEGRKLKKLFAAGVDFHGNKRSAR